MVTMAIISESRWKWTLWYDKWEAEPKCDAKVQVAVNFKTKFESDRFILTMFSL